MRQRLDAQLASLLPTGQATLPVVNNGITTNINRNNNNDHKDGVNEIPMTIQQQKQILDPDQQWVVDPYGDQGPYRGELDPDSHLPHGQGTMHYTDGRVYTGEWMNGAWHGKGIALFSNHDTYTGEYERDQRHGVGIYQWNDGRVYQGGFVNDQRHGQGLYTWPDGAKYEGNFAKGLRHGQGTYTFQDNSVYTGGWHKGKYHGHGECKWADGRVYVGEWVAGMAHGQGIETRPDGTIRHEGRWEHDRPIRNQESVEKTAMKRGGNDVEISEQDVRLKEGSHQNA